MKLVKELPFNNALNSLHAIYELSDDEMNWERKRYLVNQKYSQYAMECMDHEELIEKAVQESEYVYGTGFCDTIAECELYYKNACLEYDVLSLKRKFYKIKTVADAALEHIDKMNL